MKRISQKSQQKPEKENLNTMAVPGEESKKESKLRGRGARFCGCSLRLQTKSAGTALIFTILTVSIVLGVAFFLTNLFASKLRISFDFPNSVAAFFAAESGSEWQIYNRLNDPDAEEPSLTNGATFTITSEIGTLPIRVIGSFRGTSRALETSL